MPVMTGLEAARAIRTLAPETKIIVFSMHEGNTIRQEAQDAGVDLFLHKTTQADEILRSITALLSPLGLTLSTVS
jgi:DNA-binding NarL/FixJ family response regulator